MARNGLVERAVYALHLLALCLKRWLLVRASDSTKAYLPTSLLFRNKRVASGISSVLQTV